MPKEITCTGQESSRICEGQDVFLKYETTQGMQDQEQLTTNQVSSFLHAFYIIQFRFSDRNGNETSLYIGRTLPKSRDGFEPDFCGLGSGRVLEMRARVGSGLTMRAAGRVGPRHLRAFSSFFLFFQTFFV